MQVRELPLPQITPTDLSAGEPLSEAASIESTPGAETRQKTATAAPAGKKPRIKANQKLQRGSTVVERISPRDVKTAVPWYSLRVGYSNSKVRTETLRKVLVKQGFESARTERGKDGIYYVKVADHYFRNRAEGDAEQLKKMGFSPIIYEKTVAR